jgi:hypothetical protein
MTKIKLSSFAAWAPGVETSEAWRAWSSEPQPLLSAGAPDVKFLPAMLRRRCDPVSRMMLHVAEAGCPEALRAEVTSVFASRHGSFGAMMGMLQKLAKDAPLSPAKFSHSVHNTQAGLFSIWAGNRQASTCVAAREATFCHGFLESISMLHREPGRPVLFVIGDEPVPEPMDRIAPHREGGYAVAMVLHSEGDTDENVEGVNLEFSLSGIAAGEESRADGPATVQPDALEFIRWLHSDEAVLEIQREPMAWRWEREPSK